MEPNVPVTSLDSSHFFAMTDDEGHYRISGLPAGEYLLEALLDGTFTAGGSPSTGTRPTMLAVGDLNGDGLPDLAVANYQGNSVTVLTPQLTQTVTATANSISPLGSGTHNVEASYSGDSNYKSSLSSTVQLTAEPGPPTVMVTPSPSSITTLQALSVAVTVSGGNGSPTPTGSVTLASASYSQQQMLAAGSTIFSLPAGTLPLGSDTLTATYTPDASGAVTYTSATQSATVTVSASIGTAAPTVTVTPSSANIINTQSDTVTVSVAEASGQVTATGTVVLSSGSYSAQQTLSSGSASFNLGPGTLSSGANTLTAAYSGDSTYAAAKGTTSITVSQVVISLPAPSPVSPGSTATATATFVAGNNYSGT
jgi:hypothetical protein